MLASTNAFIKIVFYLVKIVSDGEFSLEQLHNSEKLNDDMNKKSGKN